ncbi:MAG: cupin domain-containing protein, partial [Waterburya sp.]
LQDFDGWEETSENEWHYNQFPEFTVTTTDEEIWEVTGGENWVRAATNPKAFVIPMCIKYYQTVLKKVNCLYYDEMRFIIPALEPIITEEIPDAKWFYGICADSFDFYLLQFLTKRKSSDLLNNGITDRTGIKLPVIIFSSRLQKDNFINYLKLNPSQINISNFQLPLDPIITDQDRKIIEYSKAVMNIFQSWKENNVSGSQPSSFTHLNSSSRQNIFNLPKQLPQAELFETLYNNEQILIERIVSTGQTTPEGEWYNQEKNEWLIVLQGEGELSYEDGSRIKLITGDYLLIPAYQKHRVEYTSTEPPCIWLTLFF